MPVRLTAKELEFLRDVDRLTSVKGTTLEIAREKGVVHSTVGYRLRRAGLRPVTRVEIVDIRTGRPFRELDAEGEFQVVDAPQR